MGKYMALWRGAGYGGGRGEGVTGVIGGKGVAVDDGEGEGVRVPEGQRGRKLARASNHTLAIFA